jgi:hypothetical protein
VKSAHLSTVCCAVVLVSLISPQTAAAQVDQRDVAVQLLRGQSVERARAIERIQRIEISEMTPELRHSVVQALQREAELHAQRREMRIPPLERPELIVRLAEVVAAFDDPGTAPLLARGLGTGFVVIRSLAQFGEQAVVPILDVLATEKDVSVVDDALVALRFIAEDVAEPALSSESRERIRAVAHRYLLAKGSVTSLWRAIDLAAVLGGQDLRDRIGAIGSDAEQVVARGISDPDLVRRTQERAAARLRGVPPLPRWEAVSSVRR